jgi:hypothetical protein
VEYNFLCLLISEFVIIGVTVRKINVSSILNFDILLLVLLGHIYDESAA